MTSPAPTPPAIDKSPARIAGMFDAIAPRYDLLNHVLSAGMDRRWRDAAVAALALPPGGRVVDLCTGTGDLAVATARQSQGSTVVGVDFAGEMLRLALLKVRAFRPFASHPAGAGGCDADSAGGRVLRRRDRGVRHPQRRGARRGAGRARARAPGRAAAWRFSSSASLASRACGRCTRGISATSCRSSAAWFRSTRARTPTCRHRSGAFPPPGRFLQMCESSGFTRARAVPLTFGIVYLYVAERRGDPMRTHRNPIHPVNLISL